MDHYRNDAGLAAAELALAVERHVLESGSIHTVGTVGMCIYVIALGHLIREAKRFGIIGIHY